MQVALGDRPMSITLARVWSALSAWDKTRILGSLLYMGLRPMDSESMRTEIESMKVGGSRSPRGTGML